MISPDLFPFCSHCNITLEPDSDDQYVTLVGVSSQSLFSVSGELTPGLWW